VALIHADDRHHAACRDALERIRDPLATVWPVITEAMYLLDFSSQAQEALWRVLERDAVRILPLDAGDVPRMRELMRKYRDLPMDLADAALVRAAERERISRVFTIDRRDFEVYRPRGIRRFTILP
jgi:hypothetical protein